MLKIDLEKISNNFQLWGWTPRKLYYTYTFNNLPKIFANSIPKSGTHLLERLLYLTPGLSRQFGRTLVYSKKKKLIKKITHLKNSQFIIAHIEWQQEIYKLLNNNKIKILLLIRDPRDIVISKYKYITYKNEKHRLNTYYRNLSDDYFRLKTAIIGDPKVRASSIREDFERFMPWIRKDDCLLIKYENLIGENGGGSKSKQLETIKIIYNYLNLKIDDEIIEHIASKIYYEKSKTFNKSQIGQWQSLFDTELKELFKHTTGNLLIKLGYEVDSNW